jgi:hypothetical protein
LTSSVTKADGNKSLELVQLSQPTVGHIVSTGFFCPGMEYMVKFNLQKHLEQFHTVEERNSNPGDIIKVLMDSHVFFLLLDFFRLYFSVADPDPGSGAFLTPGSGIRNRFSGSRISDPESQTHTFESLVTIFWAKKFYNSLKIGPNFFLQHFKTKIMYNFVKFVAT